VAGGAAPESDDTIVGINVTPLVDITLVLLIIFIVTAKLIVSQSIPLDLPKAATGSDTAKQQILSVIMAADGRIQADGKTLANDDAILGVAKEARAKEAELRAVIKADKEVPHGRVIHVLDLLKTADVKKIAFGVSPVNPSTPGNPGTNPVPK
jgi:biopolymer transport protein ExbD